MIFSSNSNANAMIKCIQGTLLCKVTMLSNVIEEMQCVVFLLCPFQNVFSVVGVCEDVFLSLMPVFIFL